MTAKKTPAKEVKRDFPMPYVSYYTLRDPSEPETETVPAMTNATVFADTTKEK